MPRYSRSKRQSKKVRGGSGAAEYAEKVYGPAGSQHADPNGGNVIAMNKVTGGNLPQLTPGEYNGGKKGGKVLTDIGVPAVLFLANQSFGKRQSIPNVRKSRKFYRKNRRSNRFRRSMRR